MIVAQRGLLEGWVMLHDNQITWPKVDLSSEMPPEELIFGGTEAMRAIHDGCIKLAATTAQGLIIGETGTGKDILARYIHLHSSWGEQPLIKLNCAVFRAPIAPDDSLREAILASVPPIGFQSQTATATSRTTLFLNEIALLDPILQLRLVEKLRDGPLISVAMPDGKRLELRLLYATSRQLEAEVAAGHFLPELYSMIKAVTLELPPLRQRRKDIPPLVEYFLDYYRQRFGTKPPTVPAAIMKMMAEYEWPGNIRELENLIMRYVVQGSEEAFADELGSPPPSPAASPKGKLPLRKATQKAIRNLEGKIIRQALEENHWSRRRTAHALNISYRALLYKIKQIGVPPKRVTRAGRPPLPAGPHESNSGHSNLQEGFV